MSSEPDGLTAWWRRISLRAKVTGVTVAVLALGLIAAGFGTVPILRGALVANIDAQLPSLASTDLASRFFVIEPDADEGLSFVDREGLVRSEYFIAVYTAEGELAGQAGGARGAVPPEFPTHFTLRMANAAEGDVLSLSGDDGLLFHGAVSVKEAHRTFYVQYVAMPLDEADSIVATFSGVFTTVALVTILLAALLTRGLVTLTFRRLTHVETTAMSIAAGDLSQRMTDLEPRTEVGRLNLAINTMLDRVDDALAQRDRSVRHMRRFIGDASHELRTPLVSVRGYAELYRMGAITSEDDTARAMERIEKEAIRMGGLVEDLLALARLDEERELEISAIDLRPIARDAAMDVRAAAPGRVVTVIDSTTHISVSDEAAEPPIFKPAAQPERPARTTWPWRRARSVNFGDVPASAADTPGTPSVHTTTPPFVLGEENKVRQVVTNLLGNAQRFSPAESPIEIVVGTDRELAVGTIAIVDHGEGIPPQIREQIFQRFWRADNSRARETGGSGLGLAIVASIIRALEGSVDVQQTPGGGATFIVSLPLATVAGTPEHLMAQTQPIEKFPV